MVEVLKENEFESVKLRIAGKDPIDRRPTMAVIANAMNKKEAEEKFEETISNIEWRSANRHAGFLNEHEPTSETRSQMLQADAFRSMKPHLLGEQPKDRRPIMAAISEVMERPDAETLIEEKISRHEWRMARQHSLYPGSMEPVEKLCLHERDSKWMIWKIF